MYIVMTKQSRYDHRVRVWEGTWDEPNYRGPASETVRSFHQFHEGYEPHGWIATNLTEAEFDARYAAGDRMFRLENTHEVIAVALDESSRQYREAETCVPAGQLRALRKKEELLDDLLCYAGNYVRGFHTRDEFAALVMAFDGYAGGELDVAGMNAKVAAVLDASEKRAAAAAT